MIPISIYICDIDCLLALQLLAFFFLETNKHLAFQEVHLTFIQ